MFEVADRLRNVKISASAAMTRKVRELRAQGVKIVGLSSGEPDFPTPLHAIEAANKAALAGDTKYPPQDGVKPLKEAIRRKFKRDNNLDYALEEIMVSNGSKQIMYDALMASVNDGDEVIIPAPGWISYADQATTEMNARRDAWLQHAGLADAEPPATDEQPTFAWNPVSIVPVVVCVVFLIIAILVH